MTTCRCDPFGLPASCHKTRGPGSRGSTTMPSPLSPVEEKWLKQHLRGEYYFLRAHRLRIYKIEHHEQGRQILRQLIMNENEDESRCRSDYNQSRAPSPKSR
ncbi:hypothetical protein V2W45_1334051 [Cenococcum geophilum]